MNGARSFGAFRRGLSVTGQTDPHHGRVAFDPIRTAASFHLCGDARLARDVLKPGEPFGIGADCLHEWPLNTQGESGAFDLSYAFVGPIKTRPRCVTCSEAEEEGNTW